MPVHSPPVDSGQNICRATRCGVSVVIPQKVGGLDTAAKVIGTEHSHRRSHETSGCEIPGLIIEGDYDEDSSVDGIYDNDGSDSDFNLETDSPVVESSSLSVLPPPRPRANIGSYTQHQAISSIPISG